MQLLAKDGVYLRTAPRVVKQAMLASGNRADVLINCPEGDFNFTSTFLNKRDGSHVSGVLDYGANVIDAAAGDENVLLHIRSSIDHSATLQCDLPVFEVNRPCCDWPPFEPGDSVVCTYRLIPCSPRALADLVDLRKQEVTKNLTFRMSYPDFPEISNKTFDRKSVGFTLPVGKAVGLDLHGVNHHPFHIHINPFQLTKSGTDGGWEEEWFQSGDWHDTMFNPVDEGTQHVLMQTDFFTGKTVVHCHILDHEDIGMVVVVDFTGNETTRFPPAYGYPKGCRATPERCTTPLIDPKCYSSLAVQPPTFFEGERVGNCPPPSPPPPSPPCSDSCTDVVGPFFHPELPTCAAASVAPGLPFGSLCDGNWPASVTCQQTCADVGHNYADPPCCTSRPPAAPAPSPPRYTDPSPPPIPPPSRIMFKEPEEYSCEKMRPWSGTSENCTCNNGTCTLNVTLSFGDAEILFENSGLKVNGQPVDRFHMLGFNGQSPGPTIRVHAGDTLRILLKNNLSPELVNTSSVPNNNFRQFDVVNLHTHGLHVSPLAPGDDVVNTSVPAGEENPYVYHIPEDHMGGTHWCKRPPQHSNLCAGPTPICRSRADPVFAHRALSDHAHWHGAVSIHVNFGGAGMIIVEDAVNQLPAELVDVVHGGPVEDYIVAAYHVDFKKINVITNGAQQALQPTNPHPLIVLPLVPRTHPHPRLELSVLRS